MLDAVALGEILVDMIPREEGDYIHVTGFSKNFGGAPFNYAIALSRLGHKVGAVCAVGEDPFGDFLIHTLRDEGVDTSRVVVKKARTTLAFVIRLPEGERDFFFYRSPWVETADSLLTAQDIDIDYISNSKILHVSGVILSAEPARGAVLWAMEKAREAGVTVSFDLNIRLDLWESKEKLLEVYGKALSRSDIVLVSHDEAELIFGSKDPGMVIDRCIREYDPLIVAVKLGKRGAQVYRRGEGTAEASSFSVPVADTTGAGDAWAAGFEAMMLEGKGLEECIVVANAVAAMKVMKTGAIAGLPTRDAVRDFLHERGIHVKGM